MSSATRASSDMRLWSQGGSKTMLTVHVLDARDARDRVLDPARHLAGDRAARRGQGHVDRDVAVVVDVDPVDQAELVDVGRDLRVVDGLQRRDDVVGEAVELLRRERRRERHLGRVGRRCFGGCGYGHGLSDPHANRVSAFCRASTSLSTSSMVL